MGAIVRVSGGMISSAHDYATFCQMYLNQGVYGEARILSAESIAEATRPQTLAAHTPVELATQATFYGLGWTVDRNGIYSHGGSDGTKAWVDPHRGLMVLMFTQSPGGPHPRDRFFAAVQAACDGRPSQTLTTPRPRRQDLGIQIGVLPRGQMNSLAGVQVGHRTLIESDSIRTGVTAIKPHTGNLYLSKVPAAVYVANGVSHRI